ncbi:hypothetical protein [Saccharopolyspora gregorii]|uniref:hypothetical protein n=1 Tax=Saccharopolyspora gregorii TaxID=33914 RepID=UPI0031E973F8
MHLLDDLAELLRRRRGFELDATHLACRGRAARAAGPRRRRHPERAVEETR